MIKSELVVLSPKNELRIEVGKGKTVGLTLLEGGAEVFGSELRLGLKVKVTDVKLAVFSYEGAKVSVEGETDVCYTSDEAPVPFYLGVHHIVNNRRNSAKAGTGEGPRIILAGPTDSGKSSLCKLLVNYAVRQGWKPLFIDLDIGQNSIAVPGSIGAVPIEHPIDIAEGIPLDAPLVYYHGAVDPSENPAHYKHCVERIADVIQKRSDASTEARSAGCVINTMGWVEGLGYELLVHAAIALKCDVVLVVGQDRLYSQLNQHFKSSKDTAVIKLPKSGGVVERPTAYRKATRAAKVHEYFYGSLYPLNPVSQTAKFDSLHVYRLAGGSLSAATALPLGAEATSPALRVSKVTMLGELANSLLAVSYAEEPDQLLSVNVAGFIYVTQVDANAREITFLSPMAGALPGKLLLAGSTSHRVFFDD